MLLQDGDDARRNAAQYAAHRAAEAVKIARRYALQGLCALGLFAEARNGVAAVPTIIVSKDPDCGCCGGWVEHLRKNGFVVDTIDTSQINRIKSSLGIPNDLWACHTGQAAGYVFEGHVPAATIVRFLAEKSQAAGLSVPGMPSGSPGMDFDGPNPDQYDVILFSPTSRRIYARFKGAEELPL